MRRILWTMLIACALVPVCEAQGVLTESIATNRMVVVFRQGLLPTDADARVQRAGGRLTAKMARFGIAAFEGDDAALVRMRLQPDVAAVLHDRVVKGHAVEMVQPRTEVMSVPMSSFIRFRSVVTPLQIDDADYVTGKGWAVQAAGGYGDNVANGGMSPSVGPWNWSKGAGVRIAVLDSGVDANHPDIAPNLAANMTEVNESQMASPCDTGSPQDQQGHGTWVASLAAGALHGGDVVGVAPQATLINIKVMQRTPGSGAAETACENGQPSGLLSWVLQGIDDAVAQHADVVVLSLGTLVDLTTGDGAGWKAQFDAVTYAAAQQGTVIVAALGNDGVDFSSNTMLAELPAMARGVLPVTASTNPACAENLAESAVCKPGVVTMPYYANHGVSGEIAAPGGSYPEMTSGDVSGFIWGACSSGTTNTQDGLPANGASFGCFSYGHQQYVQAMGTSASAGLVAGAVAIVKASHRNWSVAKVVSTMQGTASAMPGMKAPEMNLSAAIAAQ